MTSSRDRPPATAPTSRADLRRLVLAAVIVAVVGHGVALAFVAGGLWLAATAGGPASQAFGVVVAALAAAVTYAGVTTPDRLVDRLASIGPGRPPGADPDAAAGPEGIREGDDLRARVRRLAIALDVPEPDVRVVDTAVPNAVTVGVGRTWTVCLTRGLLDALDGHDGELDAVLAHEVAHVANRDAAAITLARLPVRFVRTLAAVLAVVFFAVGLIGGSAGVLPGFVGPVLVGTLVALPPALVLAWGGRRVVARLARRGEFVADATAAETTGDPAALASALGRLDDRLDDRPGDDLREADANLGAVSLLPVDRRDATYHPPTAARIERLRAMVAR
jgi:heat shock protein HtpX